MKRDDFIRTKCYLYSDGGKLERITFDETFAEGQAYLYGFDVVFEDVVKIGGTWHNVDNCYWNGAEWALIPDIMGADGVYIG